MQAIVMTAVGAPEVLVAREVARPRAGAGQVVVRAEAVPVLYPETKLRSGEFPGAEPETVFGFLAAGTVTEVGDGVDPALRGVRVVAATSGAGGYAEFVVAEAESVTPIPDGLDTDTAAAALMPGSVALTLAATAGLTAPATVLIQAAATGVGHALTQLCARRGLRVVATAGGPAKREQARRAGAAEVIDHTDPGWPERVREALGGTTLDVVFDAIGGDSLSPLLDLVTPRTGRVLSYGWLSGAPARAAVSEFLLRGISFTGCAGPAWLADVTRHRAPALAAAAEGTLAPVVDRVLPLAQAGRAHRLLEQRAPLGAVLLRP
ncbi:quinone oxidoreductase family protein [Nocardia thailandica]